MKQPELNMRKWILILEDYEDGLRVRCIKMEVEAESFDSAYELARALSSSVNFSTFWVADDD